MAWGWDPERLRAVRRGDMAAVDAAAGSAPISDGERRTASRLGTDSQEIKRSGIGIDNVRNRLLLLYPKGQFRIYSRQGWGTSIVIRFPLTDQDQREDG